jgi:release factor glutamine methyltransferase
MRQTLFDCKIKVKKGVFLPRPETKFWVKKVIKKLKKIKRKNLKILDIFAGSGLIGICILKNLKNAKVDFADISKRAIEQIKENLKLNKILKNRYKIYHSNLFSKIKKKKYDFIFANPPYVAKERLFEVQESVKLLEPKISWYGGEKGLKVIKKFLKQAKNYLKDDGAIFMEIDPLQKEDLIEIFKKEGYKKFNFFKDQFKKIRWVKIQKSEN